MADEMTRRERDDLAKLVRRREKLAKAEVDQIAAERLAHFEQKLAEQYDPLDAAWRETAEKAEQAIRKVNAEIRETFEQRRIPARYAPSLTSYWYGRGENATASRRAELRGVAQSRISADQKAAKAEIERRSVDLQTQLLAGGLESEEARAFLETMPTARALMPSLSVGEIEAESRLT